MIWIAATLAATIAAAEVQNLDAECWQPCTKTQGPCDFCGSGLCCRHGWHVYDGGCNGHMGIPGAKHVCVPQPGCSVITNKRTCAVERRGECMWTDVGVCVDFDAKPNPQGCQCTSYGDPHIKQFCFDKQKHQKCDHFIPGEFLQFRDENLMVQVRSESAPNLFRVTGNTAFAFTGDWFCGNTYELHVGSLDSSKYAYPETFDPRLIVHHPSYHNEDREGWHPSTTKQYAGVAAIVDALKNDACPMFSFEGGANASYPDGKELVKLNFHDGSFIQFRDFNHPTWGIGFFIHMQTHVDENVEGLCKEQQEGSSKEDNCTAPTLECKDSLFTYYNAEDAPFHTLVAKGGKETHTFQLSAGSIGPLTDEMALDQAYCGNIPPQTTPAPVPECGEEMRLAAIEHCSPCEDEAMREDCVFDACLQGDVSGGDSTLNDCLGQPDIPTYQPSMTPTIAPTRSPNSAPTPKPPQKCELSEWAEWEDCSVTCGQGVEWSLRYVKTPAAFGGEPCPENTEKSRPCWKGECPPPAPVETPPPSPNPTPAPVVDCSDAFNGRDCKERFEGLCRFDKEKKECVPVEPSRPQGECKSYGDPHVRPFGHEGKGSWNFFQHGEWLQYADADGNLIVHARTEWAARINHVTANAGFAWSGN